MPSPSRPSVRDVLGPPSWLSLIALPACYLLLLALAGTAFAKLSSLASIAARRPLDSVTVLLTDIAVLAGLAALFAAAERMARAKQVARLAWAARLLASIVLLVAIVNAAYLSVVGDQLTAGIVAMGVSRMHDAWGIYLEGMRSHAALIVLGMLVAVALPVAAHRALRKRGNSQEHAQPSWLAGGIALCAAVAWLVLPSSPAPAVQRLASNAVLGTYFTWLEETTAAEADPAAEVPQVELRDLGPLVKSPAQDPSRRYNLVLLVVESLRWDHTSLVQDGRSATPNLLALAQGGTVSSTTYTPLPHTTKALFGLHCGRAPFWQSLPHELSGLVRAECLADVLHAAGYATAFLQSAVGAFEDRPRLVAQLGFRHFEAWENISGEPLGYLASDDLSLAGPFERFLDSVPKDTPFLTTVLTSATHHTYRLPRSVITQLEKEGKDPSKLEPEQMYSLLVERADTLLGRMIEALTERGLRERTVIAVMGDHGEGFGAKGSRQHDNNYYEEGLRVPLVIAGPGIEPRKLEQLASLLDVAPTVIKLLGFEPALEPGDDTTGRDLLAAEQPPRTHYFACYYDRRCFGSIDKDRKLVILPESQQAFAFDRAKDPNEENPSPLEPNDPAVEALKQRLLRAAPVRHAPYLATFATGNGWVCPEHKLCTHPNTPEGLFFKPTTKDGCMVHVSKYGVPKQDKFDLVLKLKNVCDAKAECVLSTDVDLTERIVNLAAGQEQTVEMAKGVASDRFEPRIRCRFE